MTKKETRLLILFSLILALGVVFKGIPFIINQYNDSNEEISLLKAKRKRLENLLALSYVWKEEYDKSVQHEQQLSKQLFVGQLPDLVAGSLQGKLKQLAKESGVNVDSMSLPEFTLSGSWLLITQTMSFKTPTNNLVKLLELVESSNPEMVVIDVQLRAYRQTLNGSIKVIGFSKQAGKVENTDIEGDA